MGTYVISNVFAELLHLILFFGPECAKYVDYYIEKCERLQQIPVPQEVRIKHELAN